ncbi:unnamed protein product [Vicia faba]|uniref:Uncharacterized protein n=1 Tax=Vicia faba TaxID=3906 RepID=A0AAV1B4G0_VICFA|nr:unnamed protein product [Vicia faba]
MLLSRKTSFFQQLFHLSDVITRCFILGFSFNCLPCIPFGSVLLAENSRTSGGNRSNSGLLVQSIKDKQVSFDGLSFRVLTLAACSSKSSGKPMMCVLVGRLKESEVRDMKYGADLRMAEELNEDDSDEPRSSNGETKATQRYEDLCEKLKKLTWSELVRRYNSGEVSMQVMKTGYVVLQWTMVLNSFDAGSVVLQWTMVFLNGFAVIWFSNMLWFFEWFCSDRLV